jgi:hypothetical protein
VNDLRAELDRARVNQLYMSKAQLKTHEGALRSRQTQLTDALHTIRETEDYDNDTQKDGAALNES